ncbi:MULTISPECIES: MarR family transcriptional regulator [Streptomyces]|uniref:MarR family transcriptional regulator n=1 Tax=Streptomyces scabiei TaxID=1930 RepID=UPI0004E68255|nr:MULTISPECIES: MarR family transcriptional regulator [Streptomyces]MBP5860311.1 MarR family transcriptional regulator [Streptomyces sp. LBUM 1484]MBP5908681.1 MarR family transcriptional regulator [Streptomyces sp. LBUM 1478]MBP5927780.1 MarR family transcriptional regulator [Streptomyces sp. LBUM 1479]KFG09394.1 MarR family transcriptional regulator [Streptomyces scabiei]MBP5879336.1 MarR family transcriptional regulator [Streptomyces sp. LBUM 1477]
MNGVELFLLGRALMKIGEGALPEPPGGAGRYAGSARVVLAVAGDITAHPDSAVGEIAARTGLPQSQVSSAVARLKEAGAVHTAPDPADRRRVLVRQAAGVSDRVAQVRAAGIEEALTLALGSDDPQRLREVSDALDVLARNLLPQPGTTESDRPDTAPPPG